MSFNREDKVDTLAPELLTMVPRTRFSRRGFVVTSLVTGFAAAAGPVSAETITTDTKGLVAGEVKVPTADGEMPAYRAMPAKGGPFPTILVIQEVFGVHEHIKDICRRLAKAGYYAIAANLYARQGDPSKYTEIPKLISDIVVKVPTDEVMSDLDATVVYARSTGKADTKRLGVTGFGWGGFATWMYAAHQPALKAAVSWYGADRKITDLTPQNPADIAADIHCPVLAFYGGKDPSIPKETIVLRAAVCKEENKVCDYKIYPDAPHGFNADYRPSYRPDDAKDAWKLMLDWFKKYGVA
jgi:carboxymethylenebutenolidase